MRGNLRECRLLRTFFISEENMKCIECANRRWFGDYGLHYCNFTKKVVERDGECHINNKEVTTEKLEERGVLNGQKNKTW